MNAKKPTLKRESANYNLEVLCNTNVLGTNEKVPRFSSLGVAAPIMCASFFVCKQG